MTLSSLPKSLSGSFPHNPMFLIWFSCRSCSPFQCHWMYYKPLLEAVAHFHIHSVGSGIVLRWCREVISPLMGEVSSFALFVALYFLLMFTKTLVVLSYLAPCNLVDLALSFDTLKFRIGIPPCWFPWTSPTLGLCRVMILLMVL